MYDMTGFDYDISDVVNLLKLQVRHKNSVSLDVNCPFCGETKGKMNVNLRKNVFRCNRYNVLIRWFQFLNDTQNCKEKEIK